jgi:kinesin family protein C2/C3
MRKPRPGSRQTGEGLKTSGAEGARAKETMHINKSLSSLGDVIAARASKASHVPYRESKLTHLLQDSLGGESKTLMLLQISPVEDSCDETTNSLNFGSRVNAVEMDKPTKKGAAK